jgi:hypothetical protein
MPQRHSHSRRDGGKGHERPYQGGYEGDTSAGGENPGGPYEGGTGWGAEENDYDGEPLRFQSGGYGGPRGRMGGGQYGNGGDGGTGSGPGRDHTHQFDADYLKWRDEQIRSFDEDYHNWRQERYGKFSEEFSTWRKNREGRPGNEGGGKERK